MAINTVILSGRLTAAPELKQTQSGISVCKARLAVDRRGEAVDFIPLTMFRQVAEVCEKYCRKGSKITVVGELHMSEYSDRNGQKRTTYEVVVNNLELPPRESAPTEKEDSLAVAEDDMQLPF